MLFSFFALVQYGSIELFICSPAMLQQSDADGLKYFQFHLFLSTSLTKTKTSSPVNEVRMKRRDAG